MTKDETETEYQNENEMIVEAVASAIAEAAADSQGLDVIETTGILMGHVSDLVLKFYLFGVQLAVARPDIAADIIAQMMRDSPELYASQQKTVKSIRTNRERKGRSN